MWQSLPEWLAVAAAATTFGVSWRLLAVAKSTDKTTRSVRDAVEMLSVVAREQALDAVCNHLVYARDTFAMLSQGCNDLLVNRDFAGRSDRWMALNTRVYAARELVTTMSPEILRPVYERLGVAFEPSVSALLSALLRLPGDDDTILRLADTIHAQAEEAREALTPILASYISAHDSVLQKLQALTPD